MTETHTPQSDSSTSGRRFRYIPGLDGMRGVWVIIGPLIYHARPDVLPGGILAIDLFFVLSSFLIISIALDEWDRNGRIDLKAYGGRRVRRLLPALLLCLVALTAYLVIWGEAAIVSQWTGSIVATLTYSANWFEIVSGASYFEEFTEESPLRHVWSFAIEEQFYLFAPFFLVALLSVFRGRARAALLICAIAGALASAWWMSHLYSGQADPSRLYFGTDTRAQALFVGIALAVAVHWWGPIRTHGGRRAAKLAAYIAAAFYAVAVFEISEDTSWMFEWGGFLLMAVAAAIHVFGVTQPSDRPWHGFLGDRAAEPANRIALAAVYAGGTVAIWALVNVVIHDAPPLNHAFWLTIVACVAALYGASNPQSGPLHWFLAAAPIIFLGKISYGLYLFHLPIYLLVTPERAAALVPGVDRITGNTLFAFHLLLTFVIAAASFKLIESPVMARRTPFVGSRLNATAAVSVGAVAVVVILLGLLFTNTRDDVAAADAEQVAACDTATTGEETRVLVVGDSVSRQIGTALSRWTCDNPGLATVFNEAHNGCIVARYGEKRVPEGNEGPVGDVCSSWADPVEPITQVADREVVSWVSAVELFDPDVVIAAITPWDVTDRLVPSLGPEWTHVGEPDFDEYAAEEYRLATDVLTAGGADLYWLEGPHLNREITPQNDPARIDRLNQIVRESVGLRSGVTFVDFGAFVGEVGSEREREMRHDGVHLSAEGLEEVSPWLLGEVLDLPMPDESES